LQKFIGGILVLLAAILGMLVAVVKFFDVDGRCDVEGAFFLF
jgi:hypothetical protein